jgi:hypothetical protein
MIRNMSKTNTYNDGTRTLIESTLVKEVVMALEDFATLEGSLNGVLIGGLAVSYYVRPRTTTDIDFLYRSQSDTPELGYLFKPLRRHTILHTYTHVEVELLTPDHIAVPLALVNKTFDTSNLSSGVRVASPEALITLKTYRFSHQDKADIEALMSCRSGDLTSWLPFVSSKAGRLLELRKIYDESNSSFTWKF